MATKIIPSRPASQSAKHDLTTRQTLTMCFSLVKDASMLDSERDNLTFALKSILDQQGCEHLEGCAGLCETIDIFVYG